MPIKIRVRKEAVFELSDEDLVCNRGNSDWIYSVCPFDGTKSTREIVNDLVRMAADDYPQECESRTVEIIECSISADVSGYWDGSRRDCDRCGRWYAWKDSKYCPYETVCAECAPMVQARLDCAKHGCTLHPDPLVSGLSARKREE